MKLNAGGRVYREEAIRKREGGMCDQIRLIDMINMVGEYVDEYVGRLFSSTQFNFSIISID